MGDVPTRSRIEIDLLYPRMAASGDIRLWGVALAILAWLTPMRRRVVRYRRRWAYAAHRPAGGRHVRVNGSPRHAAPTTLFQQLGWTQAAWGLHELLYEKLDDNTSARVELAG